MIELLSTDLTHYLFSVSRVIGRVPLLTRPTKAPPPRNQSTNSTTLLLLPIHPSIHPPNQTKHLQFSNNPPYGSRTLSTPTPDKPANPQDLTLNKLQVHLLPIRSVQRAPTQISHFTLQAPTPADPLNLISWARNVTERQVATSQLMGSITASHIPLEITILDRWPISEITLDCTRGQTRPTPKVTLLMCIPNRSWARIRLTMSGCFQGKHTYRATKTSFLSTIWESPRHIYQPGRCRLGQCGVLPKVS